MTSLLSPTFSVTFQKLKWEEPNERSKKPKHPVVLIIANWIQSDCFNEMQSAPQLSFRHSSTRMHIHALLVCSLSFGAHVLQKEAANDRQGTAPSEITKHVHHTLVAGHLKKKKKDFLFYLSIQLKFAMRINFGTIVMHLLVSHLLLSLMSFCMLQASQLGVYKAFVDNYKIALETAEKCSQANIQFQKISEVSLSSMTKWH